MANTRPTASIIVAPNEDGFGPSTFAFYIVREFIEQWRKRKKEWSKFRRALPTPVQARLKDRWGDRLPDLKVLFRIWGKVKYIEALFYDEIGKNGVVQIEKTDNIIRLGKRRGEVGFENTMDNLLSYPRLSKIYQKLPFPRDCIGVLDVGVPQLSLSAFNRGVPAVTVFDHAWGRSIPEIFGEFAKTKGFSKKEMEPSQAVSRAVELVCEHEALTDMVFLFPTYIAPQPYYDHWNALDVGRVELGGVLGGKPYVLDRILEDALGPDWRPVIKQTEGAFKAAVMDRLKERSFKEEVMQSLAPALDTVDTGTWPQEIKTLLEQSEEQHRSQIAVDLTEGKALAAFRRAVAKKKLLQLDKEIPVVYVSGGGTAVWEELWGKLVKGAVDLERNGLLRFALVLTYFPKTPEEAERYGVQDLTSTKSTDPLEMKIPVVGRTKSERIRFVRDIQGGTHQEIFYGTDLIVTRAGGGTANDAIATRTPLVCVQEPGHWQVEAIRSALIKEGLARSVTLEIFRNNPMGVIEHELIDRWEENQKMRRRLDSIKNRSETAAVQLMLDYFIDPNSYYDGLVRELVFV